MNTIRRKIDFVWNIAEHTAIFSLFSLILLLCFIQIKIFEKQISCLKKIIFEGRFSFFQSEYGKIEKKC